MIKLKKLIEESEKTMHIWRLQEDAPDQVIRILHHITAAILKGKKSVDDCVKVSSKKRNGETYWFITNSAGPERGLIYKENEESWYSSDKLLVAPLNLMILASIIKRWVADKVNEAKVPTFRWDRPADTPDDVINVFHYVVSLLLKQNKNPKEWVGFFHDEDENDNPMMKVKGDWWMLVNKTDISNSLHYNANTKSWYLISGAYDVKKLNKKELNLALQKWGSHD